MPDQEEEATPRAPVEAHADPRRALDALDRAVAVARTSSPDRPLAVATPEDFRHASASYLGEMRARLDLVLMSDHVEEGLDALLQSGALVALLPDVNALVGFGDGEWRHKDVWRHTKQVVRQATPKLEVRWGALLHDIGKVRTRSISPEGEVHFFGHAEVGARMFDKMERRLALFAGDDALRAEVRFLILHHLRAAGYEDGWTDSAVRRFGREIGGYLDDLLCLARADITTKRPEKKRRGLRQIDELEARWRRIAADDAVVPPLPKGLGHALMKELGLPPSPRLGQLMRAVEGAVDAGELAAHEPIEFYVDHVRSNLTKYGL
ncbi:MAG: HDIG domain-containing protein [Polyangiaceae bacterium]|nr:HDIG domain-containing protein [Polyangiaceae bacterium]